MMIGKKNKPQGAIEYMFSRIAVKKIKASQLALKILLVGLISCLLTASNAADGVDRNADMNGGNGERILYEEGVKGLIIDNTVTIIGKRFYEAFALDWLDQNVGDIDNLSVGERPTARSGSRVWVEYNRKILFQVFLSPVRANIEKKAQIAATKVGRRVKEFEIQKALFKNPDLADDEI